ncbi:hypothetical protein ACSHWG_07525 [Leucobacter sp. Z1108]|uniref:hypothetical protein n=1 Tax=Leucobacter sp. Z1108 TaxID=3439066 RepID=UPI003F2D3B08
METKLRLEMWRHALPVLWIGLIIAISFIEAPLKFQAEGITIPLGLGIGRLVFAALNITEAVLLVMLTIVTFWPRVARVSRGRVRWWLALALVFLFKVAIVRPPLNARTDLVLAGADPGQSLWHYVYIACDLVTLVLLLVVALQAGKAVRRVAGEAVARAGDASANER